MYVLPVALGRFAGNRPLLPNIFQNIAVQIAQGGAVKDELSLARADSDAPKESPPPVSSPPDGRRRFPKLGKIAIAAEG